LFVVEALRTLMADEGFVTLLRVAEDVAVNGSSAVIVL
jgi:hypothetical protein